MARALGRDHDHIDILRRLDQTEGDVEAVGKRQCLAGCQVRLDFRFIDCFLLFIGNQHHDDICHFCGIRNTHDFQTLFTGLVGGLRSFIQTDNHVHTGVLQVQGMGMPLGAIANDGDFLSVQLVQVTVLLVIDF